MRLLSSKISIPTAVLLAFFAAPAFSRGHHELNGTWKLIPAQGELAGEKVTQTGTVTINDREHNVYISRNYAYNGATQSHSSNFTTDGRENSTIKNGKSFRSKAKWEGDTLVVTTTEDNTTAVERYTLEPDGTLKLYIEHEGQPPTTLHFQRVQ